MRRSILIGIVFSLGASFSAAAGEARDECHSRFAYYLGAQPYIVNPAVADRASTEIVAVLEDPSATFPALVRYELTIRSDRDGSLVRTIRDFADVRPQTQTPLKFRWDGTNDRGELVPDGEYVIDLVATSRQSGSLLRHVDGETEAESEMKAVGSAVSVVVDRAAKYDALFSRQRIEANDASIDTSFPYQFFFGTTHAHSNWSDGGMPVTDCTSGKYGYAGGARPSDAWSYAKNNGDVDFLAVVEHNHLMQDACSTCTAQGIRDRYAAGFTNAQSATVSGSFVGLFGMEWGVISGGGHINIYNQSKLMAWTGEPYHVLVDKSNYSQLYTAIRSNQGTLGSYGTFNHPETTDFNSWARTADGDAVMRGLSIISGPAFNTSTSFSPGGTRYTARFNQALSYGWKIAPEAHQDNHCWNYGNSTPNRTVALVPNGTAFSQASLMSAMNIRRFYAAEDRNVQLIFRTSDGSRVMGSSFSSSANVGIYVAANDPNGDGVQKIEVWGGRAGTVSAPGAAAAVLVSNTGSKTLSTTIFKRTVGETWYYYIVAVQADGNVIWSAPMWISWS